MSKVNSKEKKPIKKVKTTKTKENIVITAAIATAQVNSGLVPLTDKQEEKLNKSFDVIEKYLKGAYYSTPIIFVFSLYWMIRTRGDISAVVGFLFLIPISIGIIYSYRLFLKQSKKSIIAFSISSGIAVLYSIVSTQMLDIRSFTLLDVVGFVFLSAILIDLFRLKKYNYLY